MRIYPYNLTQNGRRITHLAQSAWGEIGFRVLFGRTQQLLIAGLDTSEYDERLSILDNFDDGVRCSDEQGFAVLCCDTGNDNDL